ncbi:lactate utilization protein C [Enterovibrio sp. ZSDZ35]|uniref:Lactate utilization protein C n=1 Tax=Enterovibrio qingdaonensis TaxID=2899818 RepID=A0ABT5QJG5_9GAMM|nr:lactate utilization protein C [Enterovibrio sp. ZSDZ35]MDD1780749.1 lactate utilization protein C [Enterovibrio sp. ZSDZ35]
MNTQNQNARAAIFAKLKSAPTLTDAKPLPEWQAWHSDDQNERTTRFIEKMSACHAEIKCTSKETLIHCLTDLINQEGFKRVLVGDNNPLMPDLIAGCEQSHFAIYDQAIETFKTSLFNEIDVGITFSQAGIADTGTLATIPGGSEPRALSLVPPTHIAIIRESDIVSNFSELMTTPFWTNAGWGTTPPTNLLLISGPSKTADIQQTLAYGAHGPKRLIVFLVKE